MHKVAERLPQSAKSFKKLPQSTKTCQNLAQSAKSLHKLPQFPKFAKSGLKMPKVKHFKSLVRSDTV